MAQKQDRQLETPVSPSRDGPGRIDANGSLRRKPVPNSQPPPPMRTAPVLEQPDIRLQEAPASPVSISPRRQGLHEPETASIRQASGGHEARADGYISTPDVTGGQDSLGSLPVRTKGSSTHVRTVSAGNSRALSSGGPPKSGEFGTEMPPSPEEETPGSPGLHYHAFDDLPKRRLQNTNRVSAMTIRSAGSGSTSSGGNHDSQLLAAPRSAGLSRPISTYTLGSELRGRTLSPFGPNGTDAGSPRSTSRRSPSARPVSYVDLLNNVPYNQQIAPGGPMNNHDLQTVVGNAASLLDTKKTLEMYRANVKKTNDASVQYEFAIWMINAAKEVASGTSESNGLDPAELNNEAKHILQRLADRGYPFAQYYLGDGFFSGLFNKNKPDHDKAFPLFVAASKHGHAEAGYRAALCYEFGWGTTKSYPKAVQFYRNSASKNHPGAATRLGLACLRGDMGLRNAYREGVKWLKRATESADFQYNTAPFELGLLHLQGHGDDIFKDEPYAAQLFTQAAELGHVQANFLMGQAYENGLYGCPKDAALSVHFYNGAATRGHAEAMMALCAWFMVGAEPVLPKDEQEACAWARQAAEAGKPFPSLSYIIFSFSPHFFLFCLTPPSPFFFFSFYLSLRSGGGFAR